jgi:CelD/BcsL family acetyltransferase involved in cellulose biosynthesis
MGAALGYRDFDYGFGGETYKRYFCDTVQPVTEIAIVRPGLPTAVAEAGRALLGLAGAERAEQLRHSLRRRWNVIEACEVSRADRFKGAALAARAALSKTLGRTAAAS